MINYFFNSQTDNKDQENPDQVTWDRRIEMKQHLHHVYGDLSQIDVNSDDFKALPPEIQHEILLEVKASFKSFSMVRMDDMPQESREFSSYQLNNLMQRSKITRQIDHVRHQLNTSDSGDIQDMFDLQSLESRRVVSEDDTHYLLFKNQPQWNDDSELIQLIPVSDEKDAAYQAHSTVTDATNTSSTTDQLNKTSSQTSNTQHSMVTPQALQDFHQSNIQTDSIKAESQLATIQSVNKEENDQQVQELSDKNQSDSQQLEIKDQTTSIANSKSIQSSDDEIEYQHKIAAEPTDNATRIENSLKFLQQRMLVTSKDDFTDEIVVKDESKNVALIESSSESEGIVL